MKKRHHRPLRLGSFEQLESRALLAYAGMPHGMMLPEANTRPDPDFDRGPRLEMHSRDIAAFDDRGPRDMFRGEAALPETISGPPVYQVPAAIVFVPTSPVVVIITFPVSPVVTQPSFSEPVRSAAPVSPPQSSFVNSLSSPASDRPGNFVAPVSAPTIVDRPSSTPPSHRGLSALTGLALGLVSTREADTEETPETTTPDSSQRADGKKLDEESRLTARQDIPAATNPEHQDADEKDLIELNQDDLRKRAKRKAAPPVVANDVRRSNLIEQSHLPLRTLDLPRVELTQIEVEVVLQPVGDDLIELLTNDHIAPEAAAGSAATPFTATALQLEASLGYHQSIEIADDVAPSTEPQQPAAVAAAALPAREAQ